MPMEQIAIEAKGAMAHYSTTVLDTASMFAKPPCAVIQRNAISAAELDGNV